MNRRVLSQPTPEVDINLYLKSRVEERFFFAGSAPSAARRGTL
jgi:hypothetical protein